MMIWIQEYLIRITAAALITGALNTLCTGEPLRRLVRLCGGACLILLVLHPLIRIDPEIISQQITSIQTKGVDFEQQAQTYVQAQTEELIKEKTTAYILDKAKACQAELTVEVETNIDPDGNCIPCAVTLFGEVTAEQQLELTGYIVDTLAIAGENVRWSKDNDPPGG